MAAFNPERWLDRWMRVGGVMLNCAGVCIVANLDGNVAEQRSLMASLDGKRGRREQVRDAMLARHRSGS